MKVRLSDISPEGLVIKDTLALEPLNKRMAEASGNDIVFLSAPQVDITICGSERGAETKGSLSTRYKQPCGRCLRELEMDLEVEANFILKPKPERQAYLFENNADMEDVGIIFFEGEHIDLEDALQETLILALSPYLLPARDKDGKCVRCGEATPIQYSIDSTTKRSLGDLLQKAGIKKT